MSVVGAFPGIQAQRRRTIRANVNPMDKSTVVSIYPRLIDERKPTIEPGRFIIQPGTVANPSLLVVSPSSWWKELDEEQPLLEIPNYSIQVADSIVKDYCNGLLASNMGDCMPGLFWVPGAFKTIEKLKETMFDDLKVTGALLFERAVNKQRNYFLALVKLADAMWSRTNGNPLTISDDMRLAAKELNLTELKEWMKDFTTVGQEKCPACGTLGNPGYPVCPNCKAIIDPVKAKALDIKFAQ